MDIESFKTKLKEFQALRDDDEIRTDEVDRVEPVYDAEWPIELKPSIRRVLSNIGITKPYQHQAEAIRKSLSGADVVLESPTASGKTLAFSAPMLDTLLRNSGSHGLMIYPMKALAFDQREQIRQICQPHGVESWPYDGDTEEEHKKVLRENPPQILLTNPEYLNASFIGWREQWESFLQNLKFVVIDEMHEYRGYFGGNMALLLRRFFLCLKRMGVSPQVFLSTATCANPVEHARNLTGREVELVSARNVFRPKRHFIFVNPAIRDFRYRDILGLRIELAALATLAEGLQTLVFCPTKGFLEDIFANCRRKLEKLDVDPGLISPFHADLNRDEKQLIQQKVKAGDIRVVFTTNALELGLDIGSLDGVILAGFPPSIMSAWQQIGRAGRGWDKDAFVLFYAMNDPIDRFFVGNVGAFLNKPFDELVVDPNNEELIVNHLPSLAEETNGELDLSARPVLGDAFYNTAIKKLGKPIKGIKPQRRLSLRGGFGKSYKLRHEKKELGQISEMRRFREAYIGAVFTFFGRKYRVHSYEEDAVVLTEAEPNTRTDPGFFTVLTKSNVLDGISYGDIGVYSGTLNIVMNFTGYKVVDENSGEVRDSRPGGEAHFQNNLHAVWIDVPGTEWSNAGIGALEHLLRVGAMFIIPADRFDASTYSKVGSEPTAYYYENYSGGIGVAKKLFEVWPRVLKKGIERASSCPCRSGCQNCIEPPKSYNISNTNIDKLSGIELAEKLLEAHTKGATGKFQDGMMMPA